MNSNYAEIAQATLNGRQISAASTLAVVSYALSWILTTLFSPPANFFGFGTPDIAHVPNFKNYRSTMVVYSIPSACVFSYFICLSISRLVAEKENVYWYQIVSILFLLIFAS